MIPQATSVRGWILLIQDPDYLRQTIRSAPEYGINHNELSHHIVHNADELLSDPDRLTLVQELVRLGKSLGLEMFVWTHEFRKPPSALLVGVSQRLDLDHPDALPFLEDRYARLYQLIPDLDGVIVSFAEGTRHLVTDEHGVMSRLPRQMRVARLAQTMWRVHERLGKTLVLRDFGESLWTRQGILLAPAGCWAMTKVVFGDWHPYCEPSVTYGYYGDRRLVVEFDLCGEYMGLGELPWADPHAVKARWQEALAAGHPVGAAGRIDRAAPGYPGRCTGAPNQINVEMFCRLLQDSSADPDQVWREWTEKTYGPVAAPAVERSLRVAGQLVRRIYWGETLGDYRIQQHSLIPNLAYALDHDQYDYMQTTPVDAEMFLIHPEYLDAEMQRRYGALAGQARDAKNHLLDARAALTPHIYDDLVERIDKALWTGEAFRVIHTAFIRLRAIEFGIRRFPNVHDEAVAFHQAQVDADLSAIRDTAQQIQAHFGDCLHVAHHARVQQFATDLAAAYRTLCKE